MKTHIIKSDETGWIHVLDAYDMKRLFTLEKHSKLSRYRRVLSLGADGTPLYDNITYRSVAEAIRELACAPRGGP